MIVIVRVLKNKRRIILFPIVFVLLLAGTLSLIWNSQKIKKAVFINEINNRDYIICRYTAMGGYRWHVLEASYEGFENHLASIDTSLINDNMSFNYVFLTSGNKFVFYYIERNESICDINNELVIEYLVDDWDILYPIRRDLLDIVYKTIFRNSDSLLSRWIMKFDLVT